jgi:hypothetical protein
MSPWPRRLLWLVDRVGSRRTITMIGALARRMTHALYDLLRGFRAARFDRYGLSAGARRGAVIRTTASESS